MAVKFYDNTDSYSQINNEVVTEFFKTTEDALVNGRPVMEFEKQIADLTSAKHCVAVGNATDALIISLMAMGIGEGDEVIVPCYSFIASLSCIRHVGAMPVLVDIDPSTYCLNPDLIEEKINKKTKAILPVHLFCQMADMKVINEIAKKHDLLVLEDSAEAIRMWAEGCHGGLLSDIGVLSFFPTKTLGAFGDAGLIMTNNDDLAKACRLIRNIGRDEFGISQRLGFNSRMDNLQALILKYKLRNLEQDINRRNSLAAIYSEQLKELHPLVITPTIKSYGYSSNHVFYVYQIQAQYRDELVAYLNSKNIETEVYYPIPFHLQPCCLDLNYKKGSFPNAEYAATVALSLPMYPDLSEKNVKEIVETIKDFYRGKAC